MNQIGSHGLRPGNDLRRAENATQDQISHKTAPMSKKRLSDPVSEKKFAQLNSTSLENRDTVSRKPRVFND